MRIRVLRCRLVKGIKDKRIVVLVPNHIGNNIPPVQIHDRTQVKPLTVAILHFRHITQPLLIRPVRGKITTENILCRDLWRGFPVIRLCAANNSLQPNRFCKTVNPLDIVIRAMAAVKFVR